MKAKADDIYVVAKVIFLGGEGVLWWIENIVGIGENAGYQHFLLYPQYFQGAYFAGSLTIKFVSKIKALGDHNYNVAEMIVFFAF